MEKGVNALSENLMENKKLNLNRPLLSVRKYSPIVTSQKDDERIVIPYYKSELKSGPVRNPGAVPFQWEQIPGQPKQDLRPRNSSTNDQTGSFQNDDINENKSFEDHDEAYVDAFDALTRTQSFLSNCSLNGLDDLDTNPHIRGFMMDRFLPEAKALTPQNEPEKNFREKNYREIKKIVHRDRPLLRYGPSFAKRFTYCDDEQEAESDDEHANLQAVCGLFPRLKGSLCLLSPVHVMNMSTREAMSPANNTLPSHSHAQFHNEQSKCDAPLSSLTEKRVISISEETKQFGIKSIIDSSHDKGFKTFQELLLADEEFDSEESSVVEKNLHVDTIQKEEITHVIDSSIEDSSDKWNLKRDYNYQDCTTVENTQGAEKDSSTNLEKQLPRGKNLEYSEFIITPPPLPKSPSDSWLWRTLPTMSAKNISQRSYPQKLGSNAITSDIKWEAVVKSTKVQRRYSEHLLTPIPETQESHS